MDRSLFSVRKNSHFSLPFSTDKVTTFLIDVMGIDFRDSSLGNKLSEFKSSFFLR